MKLNNKRITGVFFSSLFSLFIFSQCDSPNSANDEMDDDTEVINEDALENEMEEMEANWENEVQEWRGALQARMEEVEKEIENVNGDAEAELKEEMDELERGMERLKGATKEEWDEIKTDLQKLDDIEIEIETNS